MIMIWLLPQPPPSKLDGRHTRSLRKRENLLTGGRGREGREGERSQIIRRRESLVLYNILNTLYPPALERERELFDVLNENCIKLA
jgi:hypothetical protein